MKRKLIIYLKGGILMFMVAAGFLLTYAYIWIWLGLPETWWAAAVLAVLSGMSTVGLILWIGKEDHVPVRCGQCRHWTRHEEGKKMGTCFRRGFMNGVDRLENGYCDRGEPR